MPYDVPVSLILLIVALLVITVSGMGIVFLERRICGFFQDRLGPNRVGPFGTIQIVADSIKLLFKEDYTPKFVNTFLFYMAPPFVFLIPIINFVIIPFSSLDGTIKTALVGADVNIGILFFLAMGSLTTYGLAYGGWASNSKFSLLGGIRASAQLISFEVSMGLAVISLIMVAGSVTPLGIIDYQIQSGWLIFMHPVAFLIFLITAFAETNRVPFDLAEAEQELVGGYHTEYSSMRFGFYMIGEWMAVVTMSTFLVTLFLGGWHVPYLTDWIASYNNWWLGGIVNFVAFMAKVAAVCFFFIWVRWTLPRFKWDQLLHLGWYILIPVALINIVVTGFWLVFF